ncbi:unnamed protein product [Trichobilharzia regenti]|nr:unnamed protein product [Trichobilharzia regenti]
MFLVDYMHSLCRFFHPIFYSSETILILAKFLRGLQRDILEQLNYINNEILAWLHECTPKCLLQPMIDDSVVLPDGVQFSGDLDITRATTDGKNEKELYDSLNCEENTVTSTDAPVSDISHGVRLLNIFHLSIFKNHLL